MEILIAGAFVTLLVQFAKWLFNKTHNLELTRAVIIVSSLVVSVVVAVALKVAPKHELEAIGQIWVSAIGLYEVGYKFVIKPVLDKIGIGS